MSVQQAFIAAGVPASLAKAEAPRAEKAMRERGITTQARARDFLAQVLHESLALQYFEEIASGAAYEGRTDLGNTQPGDGRRFKGRGPIQLTGRANYRWAGHALGLPLEAHPELASRHDVGWRIAALYWQSKGLNGLADRGEFVTITRRINGGTNGLANRIRYRSIVGKHDCRPAGPLAVLTAGERRRCRRYDDLVKAKRAGHDTPAHRAERGRLRADMARSRKAIWRAAQKSGWDRAHRRERYALLLARTR